MSGRSVLVIDGSLGEGGGQILRTALSLSAITGRAIRIDNIRARRRNPGLAAQHVAAVRAVAAICAARVEGDEIGSATLAFSPQGPVAAGDYEFDVAAAREGGSAGSATLVLHALVPPLALASGRSSVTVHGGTHVPWSPPFEHFSEVWLATLKRIGLRAGAELCAPGFYPAGGGEIVCHIAGSGSGQSLAPLSLLERGPLERVDGRAVAANLPAHIAQRMAARAAALLREAGILGDIVPERVRAASPGAVITLTARYRQALAGASSLGEIGKPAEQVAGEAVAALLADHRTGAAVEPHLADQILVPLAFAAAPSRFTVAQATGHLETNAEVIRAFDLADVSFTLHERDTVLVTVGPRPAGGRAQ